MRSLPETDVRTLEGIDTAVPQYRNHAISGLRPVNGLDTETWEGNLFLLADSDGRYIDREDITAERVAEFLLHKKYQNAFNLFYNLDYDAKVILKLLGDKLLAARDTKILSFRAGDYILTYLPGKTLGVRKVIDGKISHHYTSFFDIAQFFRGTLPDETPHTLANVYQANIGPVDNSYLEFKGKRDEFSPRFYRRHTNAVRDYCKKDCIMTKQLGLKWLKLFHTASGFYPQRLLSSGYLAGKVLINRRLAYPLYSSLDTKIQEFAYRGYVGARIEMLLRGFIGRGYMYDQNSAYPAVIAKLPDLTDGEWIKNNERVEQKAAIGFFKIEADIPDGTQVAPFVFTGNHKRYFPTGKFVTYATIEELRACTKKDYYQILESYQFIPNTNYHPYEELINDFYARKTELKAKDNPLHIPFKVIINSMYGKSVEVVRKGRNREIGTLFYPVIGAHITGTCRARQYKFIIDHNIENETIAIATDSICPTRNLGIDSKRLGEYSFKGSADDVYYVQNGIYLFNGNWKKRGHGSVKGIPIKVKDIVPHNGKLCAKVETDRSLGLREAIARNKIEELGKVVKGIKYINLDADRKRFWIGKLTSLDSKEGNYSVPWSFNHFTKQEI